MVYAYGIRSQLLHRGSIEFALALIEKWIGRDKLVGNSASLLAPATRQWKPDPLTLLCKIDLPYL
jgi:hypothetical protein